MVPESGDTSSRAVYVVDGSRTPFLDAATSAPFDGDDLAVGSGQPLLLRQPFSPEALDAVILGRGVPAPEDPDPARTVASRLGCHPRTTAHAVQRAGGTGLQALTDAAATIAAGGADLILAGGVDAMSRVPPPWPPALVKWLRAWRQAATVKARLRTLSRLRRPQLKGLRALIGNDTLGALQRSRLADAERLSDRFDLDRDEMDALAAESRRRLADARQRGNLPEIEPQFATTGGVYPEDTASEHAPASTRLGDLEPLLERPFGLITAGNAAPDVDGAAWLLLASDTALRRHGLTPLGRLVDYHWVGLDAPRTGLGAVHAATPLMSRYRLGARDVDYWEIEEATAAHVLAGLAAWRDARYCRHVLNRRRPLGAIAADRLNPDGGALALGLTPGASAGRMVLHLLHILKRTGDRRGIVALDTGNREGAAVLLERD